MYSYFLFIFLIIILIFIVYKNVVLISRFKYNKKYMNLYQAVFNYHDDAYEQVLKFINETKSQEYKNKARILKIFSELDSGKDYSKTLQELDLKSLYYKKDKLSYEQLKLNCDSFVFMMMLLAKAYNKKVKAFSKELLAKINEIEGLENRIEYLEIIALNNCLNKYEDFGIAYAKMLHDGSYSEYDYEKNLIGLYKRIASTILAFNKILADEYYEADLHSFAKNLIGRNIMKDMGIYDAYPPIEEVKE